MTLPDDTLEKWVYKEHTKVKHEILSKYITGWIKILGTFHKLYIFDCFAGRGKYKDGSDGSPLRIIKILINLRKSQNKPKEAECFFIENNPKNIQNLEMELKDISEEVDSWLKIHVKLGKFTKIIKEILEKYNNNIIPAFFFLDPFGFGGIPLSIIKKLLSFGKTEVFITFMIRDVIRFLESQPHQDSIKQLIGVHNVMEILQEEPYSKLPKEQAILKLYRNQLHKNVEVRYTIPFKINADDKLQTTYYLIHCTNHPKGCAMMKSIMYRSGTESRFAYLGPAEGQLTLDKFVTIEILKDFLLKNFKDQTLSFQKLIYETLMDTFFIEKHYRQAVRELEQEEKISTKKRGVRGGINDNTLIIFKNRGKNIFDYVEND